MALFGWAAVCLFVLVYAPPKQIPVNPGGHPAKFTEQGIPLGSGHHAESAFRVAVAILTVTLPALLADGRLVQYGTHVRTMVGASGNFINEVVGRLVRINKNTVAV